MKFFKYYPTGELKPYIKYYVVSENELENKYKVFPSAGIVVGFQYKGLLSTIKNNTLQHLSPAGITGISDTCKVFKNSAPIGTVLVYFSEIGFTHFASHPAYELFDLSLPLDHIFSRSTLNDVMDNLAAAATDLERIRVVEQFLLRQIKDNQPDKLITEAVKYIYLSKGTIRIKELNERLCISQSPFEKRFRAVVGTTPKKFASIIRFNSVLDTLKDQKSFTQIGYDYNFFDQAHFIKDFKKFTGNTPQYFVASL